MDLKMVGNILATSEGRCDSASLGILLSHKEGLPVLNKEGTIDGSLLLITDGVLVIMTVGSKETKALGSMDGRLLIFDGIWLGSPRFVVDGT